MSETEIHKINSHVEFGSHNKIISMDDPATGLKGFIAIHRKNKNTPSFGATRAWRYISDDLALRDVLRLSKMMSYKCALAGLPYGGAKAVIFEPKPSDREKVLYAYAEQINSFNGDFITGTDVGLTQYDLNLLAKKTKFIVGLNSDPALYTALGAFYSIQVGLQEVYGSSEITGKSFAIQGLGKVGMGLLALLYPHTRSIIVADVNTTILTEVVSKYPHVKIVSNGDIYKQDTDVFCPCALGDAINIKNVNEISCKIVAGCANNQLENDNLGQILHDRKILYAPDFVVNTGGLIAVANEYEHKKFNEKRLSEKVRNIGKTLKDIFAQSKETNTPSNIIANKMAEKIFNSYS